MLTKPGELVLDPFAGSNVTGEAAEQLGRRWIGVELNPEYVIGSRFRFDKPANEKAGKPSVEPVKSSPKSEAPLFLLRQTEHAERQVLADAETLIQICSSRVHGSKFRVGP